MSENLAAFLQGDFNLFFANFSPSLVGQAPELVSIDGGQHEVHFSIVVVI